MRSNKIFIITICITFFTIISNAQYRFQKTIGGPILDWANSIVQTPDSGYIVLGSTKNFGSGMEDLYLIKTNQYGDTVWTRTYGGITNDEEGNSIKQSMDGGFIIAGTTLSFGAGNSDLYLVKTDSVGNLLWSKTYGGTVIDFCTGMHECSDGGIILSGYTNSFISGNYDGIIVRMDSLGDTIWTKTIGTITSYDKLFSIRQTSDSGFVVTGASAIVNGMKQDLSLIKLDALGEITWSKCYGDTSDEVGYSVIQTNDGGYFACGTTGSFGAGGMDIFLIKTDANGNTLWTRVIGALNDDVPVQVIQNSDGGFSITGYTDSFGSGGDDLLLLRTDAVGQSIWVRTVGGFSNAKDEGRSVIQTADNGFLVAGFTQSFGAGGGTDIFLVKTDSTGESGCNHVNVSFTEVIPAVAITSITGILSTSVAAIVTIPSTVVNIAGGITNVACSTIGLTQNTAQNHINIFPNPFNTSAVIELIGDGVYSDVLFILTDVQGREVNRLLLMNTTNDLKSGLLYKNNLASGIYFYVVKTVDDLAKGANFLGTGKLVVH